MRRWSAMTLVGVVLSACASAGSSDTSSVQPSRKSTTVLTADEIATTSAVTAYEAVQRLRPAFLRTRGGDYLEHRLKVYVDGVLKGGVDELTRVPASAVRDIHFLSSREATLRYGTGNSEGALDIRTGPPFK